MEVKGYDEHINSQQRQASGAGRRGMTLSAGQPSQSQSSTGAHASVGQFFDQLSASYDAAILKGIPPYAELIGSVLGYCDMDSNRPWSILELGCGTGNLSLAIREMFPKSKLTLVDLSPEMLTQAAAKLKQAGTPEDHLTLVANGFMALDFQPQSFDLVISSMALHHLLDSEKPVLYQRIFNWLKPGGLFRCVDETLSLPAFAQAKNMTLWEAWARESGATTEDLQVWIDHAEQHDHYAPLAEHFRWLQAVGFSNVDCYWRKLMWTTFGALKP